MTVCVNIDGRVETVMVSTLWDCVDMHGLTPSLLKKSCCEIYITVYEGY